MKNVFSKSNYLLFVTVIVLILSVINAGSVYLLSTRLEEDAAIINYTGILRGSIQRVAKLEFSRHSSDTAIDQVDQLINSFEARVKALNLQKYEMKFARDLGLLKEEWGKTKSAIDMYRKTPSEMYLKLVVEFSEKCWVIANRIVFTTQFASESKQQYFGYIFVIIGFNIIGLLLIIDLVRSYVKDQLEIIANYDALTHVHNRYAYNIILEREMQRSRRYNSPLSLIIFDIDHFKKINDTLGHKVGDSVLREISLVVQNRIRNSDVLCRIGGEEFTVITVETHLANALGLAEKLRREISLHSFDSAGGVTVSFGVAEMVQNDNPDTLFKRADAALYRAKQRGRNRVES